MSCGFAHAFPVTGPFWGPTGLGEMPTTDTVPTDDFQVGLGYERQTVSGVGRVKSFPVFSGTYGTRNGEIGAAYSHNESDFGGANSHNATFHGKYRLWGTNGGSAIAVGAEYNELSPVSGHIETAYAVASWDITTIAGEDLRLDGGGMYNLTNIGGPVNQGGRPMVGAEWGEQDIGFSAGVDYIARQGVQGREGSVVGRYMLPSGLGLQVGGGHEAGNNKFFIGAVYGFGK